MFRYTEETINVLVRDALAFEKKKRFDEALEIYEELALQGVEFAINRIPIAKHRLDNYKLRRVELFSNIISACAIGVGVVSISFNIALNLISHNEINSYFALNKIESQISSPLKLDIKYHSIDSSELETQAEFEIFIPRKISKNDLSERVLEAIDAYKQQVTFGKDKLKINIKTIHNKSSNTTGYIEYDLNNKTECHVYTVKGAL